ncbi:MAG: MBL fold metallo-hydrolase [Terriglobia bacterium]|jgi:phosphoribosyl 1,2-cyclic phosphate phosphodiesterase
MRLTFLGTGTSTGVPTLTCPCRVCSSTDARDQRTRPSLMVEYDGRVVLFDTTPDFRQQALREKISRLDAVIFTHSHADHVLGLDDTRVFYFKQQVPLIVCANEATMTTLRQVFSYIFEQTYKFGGVGKLEPRRIDGPFELWGLRFTPVPVLHGDLPVLGFRFGQAAYVTDFSNIPESSLPLLEGVEVLILDALRHKPHPTHSNLEQSLALVDRLKPRRALFTHIAHEMGHEETNATLPAHVRLAFDGLSVEVGTS